MGKTFAKIKYFLMLLTATSNKNMPNRFLVV